MNIRQVHGSVCVGTFTDRPSEYFLDHRIVGKFRKVHARQMVEVVIIADEEKPLWISFLYSCKEPPADVLCGIDQFNMCRISDAFQFSTRIYRLAVPCQIGF